MLLDAAKELIGFEFLLTGRRAAQDANVEDDNIAAAGLHAVEHISEVVHIEVIADRDQDIAGLGADRFGSQLAFQFEIELVHFDVRNAGMARAFFGNGEDNVKDHGEHAAGHGGDGLGEQVDEGDQEERERYEAEAERNLSFADGEIERDLELALPRIGVAQDKNGEAVHGETPDHAECVEVREESYVTVADDDGEDLQGDDDVDDSVARAKTRMRLAEPVTEDTVFGHAVEHAVRTHDGGIHRTRKDNCSNYNDEGVED